MDCKTKFALWSHRTDLPEEYAAELSAMTEKDIAEAFSADLAFGTAGLRGIMGAGTNRMNIYTVAQTSRAIADEINSRGPEAAARGAVVCCDCRNNSLRFAAIAAGVLAKNGVSVRLFDDMRPTPELSFAVREYGCEFGVNITASHNPKEYNGYKVYGANGAQINDAEADAISARRSAIDMFAQFASEDEFSPEALKALGVKIIGAETDEAFLARVMSCAITEDAAKSVPDMKIVYTPFHGTGRLLVPEVLRRRGFGNIVCVEEQMVPDGNFPTVASPNPEDIAGFELAIGYAKKVGSDLIIGTDPDADRIGLIVRREDGEYVNITGNQLGVLLADYIFAAGGANGRLPEKPAVVTTIVSTMMAKKVCEANGGIYGEAFTGFRFISEKMDELEAVGARAVLCFEESYGYLSGTHARDKDAVVAAMLVAELAAYHAARGRTLAQALDMLMEKYGWYREKTLNIKMPGLDGLEKMAALMAGLRESSPETFGGTAVKSVCDYRPGIRKFPCGKTEELPLKNSNVLAFELEDGCKVIIRPSGTEPKVKVYVLTVAGSKARAEELLARYSAAAEKLAD
ncbi:MAG: phospho-sugar mutase [Ruminococcaceae bacterium]|nr:phospho-sugar mutase [Oscillospiraceae bacterium]